MLWPYRRSAMKNQRRWTFGGVYPRGAQRAPSRRPLRRARGVPGRGRRRDVDVPRALPARRRAPGAARRRAGRRADVGGERHLSWDEAIEREVAVAGAGPRADRRSRPGAREEPLRAAARSCARWEALDGRGRASRVRAASPTGCARVTVEVANTTPWDGDDREDGAAAHVLLDARRAARDARRVRVADRSAGGAARRGGARAATRACGRCSSARPPHGARLADHPRGPPADRAREPGRPVRRRRDRPAARR